MTLTVGTNSYVSVSDADTYFGARLYADDWTGATTNDKERALRMAAQLIDRQVFVGECASSSQTMEWPRKNISGFIYTVVPPAVIDAQCELALALLRDDLTADDGNRGVRRLKAGSVEIEYDGRAPAKGLPDIVMALLQPFLAISETRNSLQMVV